MKDQFNREIDYVRISITDRCNLRCKYCMPEGIEMVSMDEILTYEEIIEIVRKLVKLGIKKVKITGGEPLVRKGCCQLIRQIKNIEGIESVTLTTNGILLKQYYKDLIESNIDGINISLDTMNPMKYKEITGSDCIQDVLEGIQLFKDSGIPIKINVVSMKSEIQELDALIELARKDPIDVRFIEVMPIGYGKYFETMDHAKLIESLKEKYHMTLDTKIHGNGPAIYYKIDGFKGSIGFISAIHGKFCDSCNRIRLTSTGDIKPCLSFQSTVNIKEALRKNEDILPILETCIFHKPKAHGFETNVEENKIMAAIGG